MADTDAERDAARLRALEAKLAQATTPKAAEAGTARQTVDQANMAWRMVVELVAGLVIGFGIGWGLDWTFGTRPIFLVLFVLAGAAAGIKTIIRTGREMGKAAQSPQDTP